MARKIRIGPDGNVLKDENESDSGSSNGGGGSIRRLCRLPRSIDVFGFHLELKHFTVVLLFITVTMGSIGAALFLSILTIYNFYQSRSSSSSNSRTRWKDGKALGANIKGVGDLPKPPQGG